MLNEKESDNKHNDESEDDLVPEEVPLYHPEVVDRLRANTELNSGPNRSQLQELKRNENVSGVQLKRMLTDNFKGASNGT